MGKKSLLFIRLFPVVLICSSIISHSYCPPQTNPALQSFRLLSSSNDNEATTREVNKAKLIRYRARLAYDGTHHSGFQIQSAHQRTVQGEVETVLTKRFHQPISVIGASRTDTGVHARGQAIHFDVVYDEITLVPPLQKLQYSINRMLPLDIRLWGLSETKGTSWHAIRSAKCKLYSYRFITSSQNIDPLQRYTRACIQGNPAANSTLLKRILNYFVGTHDFRPFAGSIEQTQKKLHRYTSNKAKEISHNTLEETSNSTDATECPPIMMNTTRTIYRIDLVDESSSYSSFDSNYRIDFYVHGALYKMIRNIVGTAFEISRIISDGSRNKRQMEEKDLRRLLQLDVSPSSITNSKGPEVPLLTRRDNPAKPAPPEGLTLEWVFYDDDDDENFGPGWQNIQQFITKNGDFSSLSTVNMTNVLS